jgi:hypothetical protein
MQSKVWAYFEATLPNPVQQYKLLVSDRTMTALPILPLACDWVTLQLGRGPAVTPSIPRSTAVLFVNTAEPL